MKKAVYPGSFDPITIGHLDIIKRASKHFDEVHVLVSNNFYKQTTFTESERVEMIRLSTSNLKNVVITSYDGLVVQYCKDNKIRIIIRGMRNFNDYEAEFSLFQYNKDIFPEIETFLMMPTTKNQIVSSSSIKELVRYNCDIKKYVPHQIEDLVLNKLNIKKWACYKICSSSFFILTFYTKL